VCFALPENRGSPERPIQLPVKELMKFRDAMAWPSSDYLYVSLDNQTDWFITSIEIQLTNKGPWIVNGEVVAGEAYEFRNYLGNPPPSYVMEKKKYEVCPISPKSSGEFIFNIGSFLSSNRQVEEKLTENTYEPFEWSIVGANGYKMQ
jgi:hypothetical protein